VVRLGPLAPSALLARKLGEVSVRLYAAPGRGLARLEDLPGRQFVRVEGLPHELPARARGRAVTLALEGRVQVGSFFEAGEVAARTGRLVALPDFSALPFITRGTLSAAARWLTFQSIDVHLLRAPRHRGSAVLEALAEGLIAALAEVKRAVD
jgi:DNA-binding transcriptional LysR family regulator